MFALYQVTIGRTAYLDSQQSFFLIRDFNRLDSSDAYEDLVNMINNMMNLFEYKYVCIPVNVDNAHWHLFVVDPILKTISLIDSCESTEEMYANSFNALTNFLDELWTMRFGANDTVGWTRVIIECPKQGNNIDCGVYVCIAMTYLADNLELSYTAREIGIFRYKMLESFRTNQISIHWLDDQSNIIISRLE